jgi:gas vesicle protein
VAERTTELRRDIEQTRDRMTGTMDAFGDRVSPGRMVERRVDRVRQTTSRMREQVMGVPRTVGSAGSSLSSSMGDAASSVGDRATSAVSAMGDQVAQTPQRITEGTQGNPIAAGAVAFGLGVLVGSLAPPSREEQQMAEKVLPVLQDEAKAIGESVTETAREGAQQAVEETRAVAAEAVEEVKDEAQGAVEQVKDQATDAVEDVKDEAQGAVEHVEGQVHDAKDTVQDA